MGVKRLCATSNSDLRKLAHLRKSGGEGSSIGRLRKFKYQPAQTCALAQMDGGSGSAGLRKSSLLALAGFPPLGGKPAQLAQTCAPHRPGVGSVLRGTTAGSAGLERGSGPQQSGERAPVRGVRYPHSDLSSVILLNVVAPTLTRAWVMSGVGGLNPHQGKGSLPHGSHLHTFSLPDDFSQRGDLLKALGDLRR